MADRNDYMDSLECQRRQRYRLRHLFRNNPQKHCHVRRTATEVDPRPYFEVSLETEPKVGPN